MYDRQNSSCDNDFDTTNEVFSLPSLIDQVETSGQSLSRSKKRRMRNQRLINRNSDGSTSVLAPQNSLQTQLRDEAYFNPAVGLIVPTLPTVTCVKR